MLDELHPVGKLANFRDLGGLAGVHGVIKPGVLYRSDDLATIDEEEAERLASKGLSLIIDLRSSDEVSKGRGPLREYDIDYLNLPLLQHSGYSHNLEELLAPGALTNEMLGRWYFEVFSKSLPLIIEGLHAIAGAKGAVVFHCAIGKDRTGVFAAALHAVLGTHREHIVRDFARTEDNLSRVLTRLSTADPFWTKEVIEKSGALLRAHPEAMISFLDQVDASGASLEETLLEGGATATLFANLREMALSESPEYSARR